MSPTHPDDALCVKEARFLWAGKSEFGFNCVSWDFMKGSRLAQPVQLAHQPERRSAKFAKDDVIQSGPKASERMTQWTG